MPFHVPFNQRHTGQTGAPIYIGFEVQRPQRPGFNWWGFHGMWMAFASLLTVGFLSPVPLLISLIGLRRPGKKMATLGALTSFGGVCLAVAIVFGAIASHNHSVQDRQHRKMVQTVKQQVETTNGLLALATEELAEFRDNHDGNLPNDVDANMLVIKHVDPWGESLRFDEQKGHGVIRSAGPDKKFDTKDDVRVKIDGKTDRQILLPVE